jgi:SAM-dependent methyltransferase
MKALRPFERSAQIYDLIHKAKDYDIEIIDICRHLEPAKQLTRHIPRLIDWGCGTGGFTSRFHRFGWDAVGIDSSEPMVQQALAKKVNAIHGTVADSRINYEVEAATCLFGAFSYMATDYDKCRIALNAIRCRLRRLGRFVFDVVNVTACASALRDFKEEQFENVTRKMRKSFCPKTNRVLHDIEYEQEGEKWSEHHTMRAFTMPEIEAALRHAGFKVAAMYPNEMYVDCVVFPLDSYYFTVVAIAE